MRTSLTEDNANKPKFLVSALHFRYSEELGPLFGSQDDTPDVSQEEPPPPYRESDIYTMETIVRVCGYI